MAATRRLALGGFGFVGLSVATFAIVCVTRALGFGDELVLGATPASGLALAATLLWRLPAAVAAAAGFLLAGLIWGLSPGHAAGDAAAHGGAALAASALMRNLARRGLAETRIGKSLGFFAGVAVFTAIVASAVAAMTGFATPAASGEGLPPAALVAIFEPFGLLTGAAAALTARDLPRALARPKATYGILGVGLALTLLLGLLLRHPEISRSGAAFLLSMPYCLWVAMQRRSADGAALSLVASHVVLWLTLRQTGGVTDPVYVSAVLYLDLLVASCQLVHAVNLDRLAALAAVEAHQQNLEARVAERTARLNAMTERALAADAAKSRFLATVSHEVRTPLNGVIGMSSVVLAGQLEARTRANVELIRTSGLHLLDVINRILDFSKLEQTGETVDAVAFDLAALVDEVVQEARFGPHATGLALAAQMDPGLRPRRLGYRQGVRQILTNLVGNAMKFTEAGSVLVRASSPDGRLVRLEVEDTGVGIPLETQARIFLPFEQGDGSMTRRYGGTGLGLAICAELAQRMGGRIGVSSTPGRGATFWVELPLPAAREGQAGDAPPARVSA